MRLLLLGGNGQVGIALRRSLAPLGDLVVATRDGIVVPGGAQEHDIVGRTCEVADLDNLPALQDLVERTAPNVVVNAAAYTAVDRAESDPAAAFRANAGAPGAIAEACAARGALLVHYSTDYVFDGGGTRPYREDDHTAPLGVYGASKRAGELAVEASGCRHLMLRTAWVYAGHGHNFLRTMLRVGAERDAMRVVADQRGTPTPAWLIADTTAAMLRAVNGADAPDRGTWHLTATGETTWHGFAEAIFEGAVARGLLARHPLVEPIATADYPTPAARPAYSVLDTRALRRDFALPLPSWQDGLARVLDGLADGQGAR